MNRVEWFADTGYWIALTNTRDDLEEKPDGPVLVLSAARIVPR